MKSNIHLGKWGERVAEEYLLGRGYIILDRNYRTAFGEIDLIAQDGSTLVFVEVKTRTSNAYGYPEDAISNQKKEHLLASAQTYLQTLSETDQDWRIDVLAIERRGSQKSPVITHFENIITDLA